MLISVQFRILFLLNEGKTISINFRENSLKLEFININQYIFIYLPTYNAILSCRLVYIRITEILNYYDGINRSKGNYRITLFQMYFSYEKITDLRSVY